MKHTIKVDEGATPNKQPVIDDSNYNHMVMDINEGTIKRRIKEVKDVSEKQDAKVKELVEQEASINQCEVEVEVELKFTATPVKTDDGIKWKKWKCSKGCFSKDNNGFWSQKQDVIKHIALKHGDHRIKHFECRICFGENKLNPKVKRYTHVSGYQVIEHLRVKHHNLEPSESHNGCLGGNILALFNRKLVRANKVPHEKWTVYIDSELYCNNLLNPTESDNQSYDILHSAIQKIDPNFLNKILVDEQVINFQLQNERTHDGQHILSSTNRIEDLKNPVYQYSKSSLTETEKVCGEDQHSQLSNLETYQTISTSICLVCGDWASGRHYTVMSCGSCKIFFKRTISRCYTYSCKYANSCKMDMYMRKKCQACRLKKCYTVGMRMECVAPAALCASKKKDKKVIKHLEADLSVATSNIHCVVKPLKPEEEELINRLVYFQVCFYFKPQSFESP